MGSMTGTVGLIFTLFALLLAVLWTLLPFAVFGIKPRMDAMLKEARIANQRLQILIDLQASAAAPQTRRDATNSTPSVLPSVDPYA